MQKGGSWTVLAVATPTESISTVHPVLSGAGVVGGLSLVPLRAAEGVRGFSISWFHSRNHYPAPPLTSQIMM